MQKISFIDSSGMRAVIHVERAAREQGLPLVVAPPPAPVIELLNGSGLAGRLSLGPQAATDAGGHYHERIELELPRDDSAPGRARAEVREAGRELPAEQVEVAALLTSELVTNAVIHPPDPVDDVVGLRIVTGEERLRVEVGDSGGGFDPERPEPREPDRGGRGLLLVDRLSDGWGAGPGSDGRFTVWFELSGGSA